MNGRFAVLPICGVIARYLTCMSRCHADQNLTRSRALPQAGHSATPLPDPERRKKKQALSKVPAGQRLQAWCPQRSLQPPQQPAVLDLWGSGDAAPPAGTQRRRRAPSASGSSPVVSAHIAPTFLTILLAAGQAGGYVTRTIARQLLLPWQNQPGPC